MHPHSNRRIAALAVVIFALDQLTKLAVLKYLPYADEWIVIDGFFKLVHWGNTGAAWSLFHGKNELLAIVSLVALLLLFLNRRRFDTHPLLGWLSLGLIFGGIAGNLTDRLLPSRRHVIDFIYFYVTKHSGGEAGFPAFNVADSAICIGVGLLFIATWQSETQPQPAAQPTPAAGKPKD